jgi:hypothetical protein
MLDVANRKTSPELSGARSHRVTQPGHLEGLFAQAATCESVAVILQILSVELLDRFLGFRARGHLHEPESPGLPRGSINAWIAPQSATSLGKTTGRASRKKTSIGQQLRQQLKRRQPWDPS